MVLPNPRYHQTPQEPRRAPVPSRRPERPSFPTEPVQGDEKRRSELYGRMMQVQASPALREASPSVYRLAMSVAMLAWPDLFASVTALEEHTGLTRRTVLKGLRSLEGIGFLATEGWRRHEGGSYTRLRRVHWGALGTVAEADEVLSRRCEGGERTDTPRGEHTDTRKQQVEGSRTEEGGTPTGVTEAPPTTDGDPQAGFEGKQSHKRTKPEGKKNGTHTERGSSLLKYQTDLEAAEGLKAIGLSPSDAMLYVSHAGPDLIASIMVKVGERQATTDVRNPAGLAVTLLKQDHPAIWLKVEDTRRKEAKIQKRKASQTSVRSRPKATVYDETWFRDNRP